MAIASARARTENPHCDPAGDTRGYETAETLLEHRESYGCGLCRELDNVKRLASVRGTGKTEPKANLRAFVIDSSHPNCDENGG